MKDRVRQNEARAVLLAARNRFGTRSFLVDPKGPNAKALREAARFDWCWFEGNRCAITASGMAELEPYRSPEVTKVPRVTQWICPVCLDVVSQPDGDTGLPETVSCPTCRRNAFEAADALMRREREGVGN